MRNGGGEWPEVMTIRDMKDYIDCGINQAYALCDQGLPHAHIGKFAAKGRGAIRVLKATLDRHLAEPFFWTRKAVAK